MARIYKQITDLIGHTPLVELNKYSAQRGLETPVLAKVEFFNPGGSVKDRIALAMIEAAERDGKLKPGETIIEPTSGNTGVGLALVSAVKGYKLILTMPETMSIERRNLVKAYGAQVKLTSGKDGMPGAIKAAEELRDSIPGSVILEQFENSANPQKHYETTGVEIWNDTDGKVDIFVAGVGTGGTISGIGRRLKEKNPNVKIIAVEPTTSPVLNGGKPGPHKIQGIGAGFVPKTYDPKVIDDSWLSKRDCSWVSLPVQPHTQPLRLPSARRTKVRQSWLCCPIRASAISRQCSTPSRSIHFNNNVFSFASLHTF